MIPNSADSLKRPPCADEDTSTTNGAGAALQHYRAAAKRAELPRMRRRRSLLGFPVFTRRAMAAIPPRRGRVSPTRLGDRTNGREFRREMSMKRDARAWGTGPWIGRGVGRLLLGAAGAALMLVLAGCGAAAATGSSHTSSTTGGTALVKIRTISVAGKSTKVLTTKSGQTLYWFSIDTTTATHCTASCAAVWPPLLAPGNTIAAPPGLSGHLSVVKDALGNQVAYNGYLLYTYVADTAPGQANGEGLRLNGGLWWVAETSLSSRTAGGGAAPTSSSSSSSGGGYGG